jgi:hypothetical protein
VGIPREAWQDSARALVALVGTVLTPTVAAAVPAAGVALVYNEGEPIFARDAELIAWQVSKR